ncbi:hypothetical protein Syun_019348 [Stephania yunnanensis]|uniref:Uncharacterized protein n=1 Tax=Stephania yunnanensis TaxID=152371 RepID=A0AAP0ITZ8_9MAGN
MREMAVREGAPERTNRGGRLVRMTTNETRGGAPAMDGGSRVMRGRAAGAWRAERRLAAQGGVNQRWRPCGDEDEQGRHGGAPATAGRRRDAWRRAMRRAADDGPVFGTPRELADKTPRRIGAPARGFGGGAVNDGVAVNGDGTASTTVR